MTVMDTFKGQKHAPTLFDICFAPQYYNHARKIECYPGSVFEGDVKITLAEPLPAQHLKLVFKAVERVNYDAMGWEKIKNDDGRLFAVRTTLWGSSATRAAPWPVLEAGEHRFPFVCEMPLINYPPSFDHYLIATTFTLIASLERPGETSFYTAPFNVHFYPILETSPQKPLSAFQKETQITARIHARLRLPSVSFNLLETKHIPIALTLQSTQSSPDKYEFPISNIRLYLKRYITIVHKTFSRTEALTITHLEHRLSHNSAVDIMTSLPIPYYQAPTTTYSNRFTVEYKLCVSVKIRHGPLVTRKKIFAIPITFGTLMPGAQLPPDLMSYAETWVIEDTSLRTKPKFLRHTPMNDQPQLPAYDLIRPPSYKTVASDIPVS
ncbi:uncharacterized protein BYT42DRAFT_552092 [Radiomyces spectabilis]|uniref:uncharacterized protein n=1 Tax=Radiomyces spectabilis TaxID=64574 RepID=UPI00222118FC|nr:uncharacterized protein BYT42DRAFT_552092 [Radiomyces spectabilis]KAI8393738.1 hypothetical protein BYT42DRAFT_552092 [Radiomyces spectabilis]